jgi:hypothetical protein
MTPTPTEVRVFLTDHFKLSPSLLPWQHVPNDPHRDHLMFCLPCSQYTHEGLSVQQLTLKTVRVQKGNGPISTYAVGQCPKCSRVYYAA